MEQIKTLSDINRYVRRLEYCLLLPPNLELKITLGMDDYMAIQKEFLSLMELRPNTQEAAGNTWITYQYMGVKTNIELVN